MLTERTTYKKVIVFITLKTEHFRMAVKHKNRIRKLFGSYLYRDTNHPHGGFIFLHIILQIIFWPYNYHNSGHHPSSCLLFKTTFRRLDFMSVRRQACCISWFQLYRFHLKTKTESSLPSVYVLKKDRTMGIVQNYNSYINVPSSLRNFEI
jgi:hypothetical protein